MRETVKRVVKFNANHQPAGSPKGGEFAPKGSGAAASAEDSLREKILLAEEEIRYHEVEHMRVWKDGKLVISKTDNQPHTVFFPNDAGPLLNDAVLTHNHPSSTSFSFDDVNAAVMYNMAEFRAVARNGVTYVLKRPDIGWQNGEDVPLRTVADQIQRKFNELEPAVHAADENRLKALRVPIHRRRVAEELGRTYHDRIWQQVFEHMGFLYEVEGED